MPTLPGTAARQAAIPIVKQSMLCHPDWDLATHLAYLESEAGIDTSTIVGMSRYPEGVITAPLRDYVKSWLAFPQRFLSL